MLRKPILGGQIKQPGHSLTCTSQFSAGKFSEWLAIEGGTGTTPSQFRGSRDRARLSPIPRVCFLRPPACQPGQVVRSHRWEMPGHTTTSSVPACSQRGEADPPVDAAADPGGSTYPSPFPHHVLGGQFGGSGRALPCWTHWQHSALMPKSSTDEYLIF